MAEIAAAFVSIVPEAKGFTGKLNSQITPGINSTGKKAGIGFGKLFAAGAALGLGAKAFSFLTDSVTGFAEHNAIVKQTENIIKRTGGAANVTAGQVGKLSDALERKTGIDGDAIAGGAKVLLSFTGIRNEVGKGNKVFNEATKTITDMSAFLGGDLQGSAIQVGKALNDPIKGVSALSKVGVSFTDQQKAQIKTFVESGKTIKAQKVILAELGKEFGGAAKAAKSPTADLTTAFHALQDQVGAILLPAFTKVAGVLSTKVVPAFSSFVTQAQTGVGTGGQVVEVVKQFGANLQSLGGFLNSNRTLVASVVGAFVLYRATLTAITVAQTVYTAVSKAAAIATKAFAIGQGILNAVLTANPIGLVIAGIAALVAGFVIAYKKSDTFRGIVNAVGNALKSAAQAVLPLVKRIGSFVADLAGKALPVVKRFASFMVGVWSAEIRGGVAVVSAIIGAVKNFVTNVIAGGKAVGDFARKVGEKIGAAIGFVKELPGKAQAALGNVGKTLFAAGEKLIQGLIDGLTAKLGALKAKLSAITNFVKDHKGPEKVDKVLLFPAGQQIMDGLINGIASREKALGKKLGKVTKNLRDKVASTVDGLKGDFSSLSDSVASNLTGSLFGFDTASAFLGNLTTVKGNLGAALSDFKVLKGFGLPSSFLAQLFADGGFPLIHELAADKGQAQAAASIFGDIQSLSGQLGNSVAQTDIGPKLDQQVALLKAIDRKLGDAPERTGAMVGGQINKAAATGRRNGKKGKQRR